jgi:hypothetical protein
MVTVGSAELAALSLAGLAMTSFRDVAAPDRFWSSLRGGPVLICIGGDELPDVEGQPQAARIEDLRALTHQRVYAEDAVAMTPIAAAVHAKGSPFRVLTQRATTPQDLEVGSSILIGAKQSMDAAGREGIAIPVRTRGSVGALRDDSGRGGPLEAGVDSEAARGWGGRPDREFLSNPASLERLNEMAPGGLESRNLQVVLATNVVRGAAGAPEIVASHFWQEVRRGGSGSMPMRGLPGGYLFSASSRLRIWLASMV